MNEIRIPYKPNNLIFILAIAFFGALAVFMGNVAVTNDRGLILNRIFEFSVQGATIFYWVISGVAFVFVLAGTFALIKSAIFKREIVISDKSITSPKNGFSKLNVTVGFSEITNITVQTIQKTKILNIDHSNGRLSIPNSMLPSKKVFEELVLRLQSKVNG